MAEQASYTRPVQGSSPCPPTKEIIKVLRSSRFRSRADPPNRMGWAESPCPPTLENFKDPAHYRK
jgi:hypothetical protein